MESLFGATYKNNPLEVKNMNRLTLNMSAPR